MAALFVYSGSSDNTLRKIDFTGSQIWSFTGHSGTVNAVAVDQNNNVYSGSYDSTVRKIDSDGNEVWSFTGHTDRVGGVDVDQDGYVYSGARGDDTVKKLDSDGNEVWSFSGHTDHVLCVAVDQNGNVYSGSADDTVRKIDSSGSQVWSFTGHTNWVTGVAVDQNGNVYSGSADGSVRKLDSNGSETWSFTGHSSNVFAVAVDQDGYVYSGGLDDTVRKTDSSGSQVWSFAGTDSINSITVDQGGYVYSGGQDDLVRKIDSSGSQVWSFSGHTNTVFGLAQFTPPPEDYSSADSITINLSYSTTQVVKNNVYVNTALLSASSHDPTIISTEEQAPRGKNFPLNLTYQNPIASSSETDFSQYSTGDLTQGWTNQTDPGEPHNPTFQIISGPVYTGGQALELIGDPADSGFGADIRPFTWDEAGVFSSQSDFEITTKFKFQDNVDNDYRILRFMMFWQDTEDRTGKGIRVYADASSSGFYVAAQDFPGFDGQSEFSDNLGDFLEVNYSDFPWLVFKSLYEASTGIVYCKLFRPDQEEPDWQVQLDVSGTNWEKGLFGVNVGFNSYHAIIDELYVNEVPEHTAFLEPFDADGNLIVESSDSGSIGLTYETLLVGDGYLDDFSSYSTGAGLPTGWSLQNDPNQFDVTTALVDDSTIGKGLEITSQPLEGWTGSYLYRVYPDALGQVDFDQSFSATMVWKSVYNSEFNIFGFVVNSTSGLFFYVLPGRSGPEFHFSTGGMPTMVGNIETGADLFNMKIDWDPGSGTLSVSFWVDDSSTVLTHSESFSASGLTDFGATAFADSENPQIYLLDSYNVGSASEQISHIEANDLRQDGSVNISYNTTLDISFIPELTYIGATTHDANAVEAFIPDSASISVQSLDHSFSLKPNIHGQTSNVALSFYTPTIDLGYSGIGQTGSTVISGNTSSVNAAYKLQLDQSPSLVVESFDHKTLSLVSTDETSIHVTPHEVDLFNPFEINAGPSIGYTILSQTGHPYITHIAEGADQNLTTTGLAGTTEQECLVLGQTGSLNLVGQTATAHIGQVSTGSTENLILTQQQGQEPNTSASPEGEFPYGLHIDSLAGSSEQSALIPGSDGLSVISGQVGTPLSGVEDSGSYQELTIGQLTGLEPNAAVRSLSESSHEYTITSYQGSTHDDVLVMPQTVSSITISKKSGLFKTDFEDTGLSGHLTLAGLPGKQREGDIVEGTASHLTTRQDKTGTIKTGWTRESQISEYKTSGFSGSDIRGHRIGTGKGEYSFVGEQGYLYADGIVPVMVQASSIRSYDSNTKSAISKAGFASTGADTTDFTFMALKGSVITDIPKSRRRISSSTIM